MKKSVKKIGENLMIFAFGYEKMKMWLRVSVMIMPLYHMLIQMLIKFRQIGSD
jgi:hypothetical protein